MTNVARTVPKPIVGFTLAPYAWLIACDRCGVFELVFTGPDADRWAVHHARETHRL